MDRGQALIIASTVLDDLDIEPTTDITILARELTLAQMELDRIAKIKELEAILGRKNEMDFAQELEDLVNDYLSWSSDLPPDRRRENAIKALEEQLAALKTQNR